MKTAILLLAAGASRRFGEADKLLSPWRGKPLARHAAEAALAVPAERHIAVVSSPEVAALLPEFRKVEVAAGCPQSESLKAGVSVAAGFGMQAVLVVLADMPQVTPALLKAVIARGGRAPAAASDGTRIMPPALLPATLFPAVAGLTGDRGAGALLADLPAGQRVAVDDAGILVDIDTPEDLALLGDTP